MVKWHKLCHSCCGCSQILTYNVSLKVRLVEGIEKWEDEKLWEDGKVGGQKIFSFPSHVFDWRDEKMGGWKTLLFGWREKWKDKKCNLYKLTIIPLLHNM